MSPSSKVQQRCVNTFRLRCPRCGSGKLFSGWFAMHEKCSECELDFVREPGFYLGSIYFNYGMTVILVTSTYVTLTLGLGFSRNILLAACTIFSALFPLWFFRYARSMWLGLMYQFGGTDTVAPTSKPPTISQREEPQQRQVPAAKPTHASTPLSRS